MNHQRSGWNEDDTTTTNRSVSTAAASGGGNPRNSFRPIVHPQQQGQQQEHQHQTTSSTSHPAQNIEPAATHDSHQMIADLLNVRPIHSRDVQVVGNVAPLDSFLPDQASEVSGFLKYVFSDGSGSRPGGFLSHPPRDDTSRTQLPHTRPMFTSVAQPIGDTSVDALPRLLPSAISSIRLEPRNTADEQQREQQQPVWSSGNQGTTSSEDGTINFDSQQVEHIHRQQRQLQDRLSRFRPSQLGLKRKGHLGTGTQQQQQQATQGQDQNRAWSQESIQDQTQGQNQDPSSSHEEPSLQFSEQATKRLKLSSSPSAFNEPSMTSFLSLRGHSTPIAKNHGIPPTSPQERVSPLIEQAPWALPSMSTMATTGVSSLPDLGTDGNNRSSSMALGTSDGSGVTPHAGMNMGTNTIMNTNTDIGMNMSVGMDMDMTANMQLGASNLMSSLSMAPFMAGMHDASVVRPYQNDLWMLRYQELCEFRRHNGHCMVEPKDGKSLSQWVKRQRYQYKQKMEGQHSTLTDDRQAALEKILFCWDSHAAVWTERYEDLKRFKAREGHCNVPTSYPENPKLGVWVKGQRRQYNLHKRGDKSTINPERINLLNDINFEWDGRQAKIANSRRNQELREQQQRRQQQE